MSYQQTVNDLVNERIYTNSPEDPEDNKKKIWPKYCYYFTDLQNALGIFKSGKIYSRNLAQQKHLISNDIDSPAMLQSTDSKLFNYVQLYFRPKTPLLNYVGGFRPQDDYKSGTKCPFPIYFLFDLSRILELKASRFSPVSLIRYRSQALEDGPAAFYDLPFEAIYSDGPLSDYDSEYYRDRKHAEVVVRDQLLLSLLKKIVVRTDAEADTLKQELLDRKLDQYINKIKVDREGQFFFKRGGYFDHVAADAFGVKAKLHAPKKYFYPSTNGNLYIKGSELNQYLGFKMCLKYVDSPQNDYIKVFPHPGEYYSSDVDYRFRYSLNRPYLIKLYLNNQSEPSYYKVIKP